MFSINITNDTRDLRRSESGNKCSGRSMEVSIFHPFKKIYVDRPIDRDAATNQPRPKDQSTDGYEGSKGIYQYTNIYQSSFECNSDLLLEVIGCNASLFILTSLLISVTNFFFLFQVSLEIDIDVFLPLELQALTFPNMCSKNCPAQREPLERFVEGFPKLRPFFIQGPFPIADLMPGGGG